MKPIPAANVPAVPTPPSDAGSANAPGVAAASPVAAPTGQIVLESRGYVIPAHQILVSPKVQGMVVKLDIEEGRRVDKGALLAEIESIEFQSEYQKAVALLELAKARLAELENGSRPEEIGQAEAELAQAQEEQVDVERIWKRNIELRKTNAVTEQEWQQSESKHLAMLRRIEQLRYALQLMHKGPREERILAGRAEVKQYEAELQKAKWRLDNCRILAPISGTILKKNAEEGNIVNTLAMNGSFSLCEMADLSDLEIDLKIQERDVAKVFVDQACRVRCEAYPDRVYEGFVSRLMPIADRAQAAVPVRVKVRVPQAEEGVYLKPEMGANVSFYDAKDPQRVKAAATSTPK
ncbi:MAG: efflux RND transporter periplasmic adaptor subunit [Pirellulales bacterium]